MTEYEIRLKVEKAYDNAMLQTRNELMQIHEWDVDIDGTDCQVRWIQDIMTELGYKDNIIDYMVMLFKRELPKEDKI